MAQQEPLISAPLGANYENRNFYLLDDFATWLESEEEAWSWLLELENLPNQQLQDPVNRYRNIFSRVRNALNPAIQAFEQDDDDQKQQALQNLNNQIHNIRNHKLVLSNDPEYEIVARLAEGNINEALWAIRFCLNLEVNLQDQEGLSAIVRLTLYNIGVKERAYGEVKSLNRIKGQYSEQLEKLIARFEQLRNNISQNREEHDKTITIQQENLSQVFQETRDRLSDLENTYDKWLATKKPVRYWSNKGKTRYSVAGVFGLIFLTASWFVYQTGSELFRESIPEGMSMWENPSLLIGVSLFIGLSVWMLRIIARFIQKQLSLADDARERATMVLTYLALLRSGEGLEENDKALILSALFRPSEGAGGGEDWQPRTMADLAARLMAGRQ